MYTQQNSTREELAEFLFIKQLNMGFPLQARKWLSLLKEDEEIGLRLKPCLTLDESYLGFSFETNELGLRGPCKQDGAGVILGTSFAMGFAVNRGENWYDTTELSNFLNLGLPVGLHETYKLLKKHYRGSNSTCMFLYHPNVWTLSVDYLKWQSSGQSLFKFMRWETGLVPAFEKSTARLQRFIENFQSNEILEFLDGIPYLLNPNYAPFEVVKYASLYESVKPYINGIGKLFDRILIFRIPTKEEIFTNFFNDHRPLSLRENHLAGWKYFKTALGSSDKIEYYEDMEFTLTDYHPADTHWNSAGNARFQTYALRALLSAAL